MQGRIATTLAVLMLLVVAAPASATNFTVTRLDDPLGATCTATTCDSLRAAVTEANKDAKTTDSIALGVATYTLSQAQSLTISGPLTITGVSARRTIIQGNGATRVLNVTVGPVTVQQLTIQGGKETAQGQFGGNILNTTSVLNLLRVRLTGGQAQGGAGLATVGGAVTIRDSLIDHNTATFATTSAGGGILTQTTGATTAIPASVALTNSTVALNTVASTGSRTTAFGGGIYNAAGSSVTLQGATIARNTMTAAATEGAGLYDGSSGNISGISSSASIIASNLGAGTEINCFHNLAFVQPNPNLEGVPASCGFARAADPQLATTLSNQGGYTDVLTIPATSPAKGFAANCPVTTDQRDASRTAPCDVGAFEEGVTAPVIDPVDTGPGPQPQPQPSPTPTPTPTVVPPKPVFHKTVVVKPVSGKVKIKLKGSNKFVTLTAADDIPLGSTIDVKAGKIQLSSVPKKDGTVQTATFFGGIFKVTQSGRITDLRLTEGLAPCGSRAHASAAKAKKKPKTRHLWGNGKGAFRTTGRYSAATVRGTEWLVQDSCSGTLTRVKHGVVNVRDTVRHKTIVVRAGHRYTAKPKKKK
jgi:hypothetical protein